MTPPDNIPPQIAFPLIIFLWLLLFWMAFRTPIKNAVNDFFAHRRHIRRERNRIRITNTR